MDRALAGKYQPRCLYTELREQHVIELDRHAAQKQNSEVYLNGNSQYFPVNLKSVQMRLFIMLLLEVDIISRSII